MRPLNALEIRFINETQGGFPLCERPFARVAARLGVSEVGLIAMVERLLVEGLLSRFGPLYDAERLGGGLTLAALAVPEDRFDEVAERVNALPEVAHNYRREHPLNMWFVVACDRPAGVAEVLGRIRQETGLEVYDLPKRRTFYLGLMLALSADGSVATVPAPESVAAAPGPLSAEDRRLVAATQAGLPLEPRPWAAVGGPLGMDGAEVMARLGHMLNRGQIRRIGAVPNHYRVGLRANGMTVWDVPDEQVSALGGRIGRLGFVSHCYERPRQGAIWPYNLFAMVHGEDRDQVRAKTRQIAGALGGHCRRHEVLFSSAILKKTGLRLAA